MMSNWGSCVDLPDSRAAARWAAAVGSAALMLLVGCGEDPGVVDPGGPAQGDEVDPVDALKEPPLRPAGGVPITADPQHVWLSDFEQLATYAREDQRWTVIDLPWERELLSNLTLSPADGVLFGTATVCPRSCAEMEETVAPQGGDVEGEVIPFMLDDEGTIRELDVSGATNISVISRKLALPSKDGSAQILIDAKDKFSLYTISSEGAVVEEFESSNLVHLCPDRNGWLAVERVEDDAEGAVRWDPFPENMSPRPVNDSWRIIGGESIDSMTPVAIPEELKVTLAARVGQAFVCLPDRTTALVGTADAWEHRDGNWIRSESTMPDFFLTAQASQVFQADDGTVIAATVDGTLIRSPEGAWSLYGEADTSPTDPAVVVMGELVLEYHRPQPPPPPDDADGGQEEDDTPGTTR